MCHWKENGKKRSLVNVFKKERKVSFTRKIELLPRNDFKKGEKYLSAAAIKERSEASCKAGAAVRSSSEPERHKSEVVIMQMIQMF